MLIPSLCVPPSLAPKGRTILPLTGQRNLPEPRAAGCGRSAAGGLAATLGSGAIGVKAGVAAFASIPAGGVEVVAPESGAMGAILGEIPLAALVAAGGLVAFASGVVVGADVAAGGGRGGGRGGGSAATEVEDRVVVPAGAGGGAAATPGGGARDSVVTRPEPAAGRLGPGVGGGAIAASAVPTAGMAVPGRVNC